MLPRQPLYRCFRSSSRSSRLCPPRTPPQGHRPKPSHCDPTMKKFCCLNDPSDPSRGDYCNESSGCNGPCPHYGPPPPPPPPTPPSRCNGSCKTDADCHNHGARALVEATGLRSLGMPTGGGAMLRGPGGVVGTPASPKPAFVASQITQLMKPLASSGLHGGLGLVAAPAHAPAGLSAFPSDFW